MEHQPDIENPMSESEALTYWMNKANKYGEVLDEILSLCVYNESSPELVGKVEKLAAYAFPKSTTKELPKAMNDAVSAIYNAMQEVEKMPADIRLTKAVTFLSNAKGCVCDFIDGVEREPSDDKIIYHAVEYAGYWHIQTDPAYGGDSILDAEHVGRDEAEKNAKLIARLLNFKPLNEFLTKILNEVK